MTWHHSFQVLAKRLDLRKMMDTYVNENLWIHARAILGPSSTRRAMELLLGIMIEDFLWIVTSFETSQVDNKNIVSEHRQANQLTSAWWLEKAKWWSAAVVFNVEYRQPSWLRSENVRIHG